MKKFLLITAAVFFIFSACDNGLLPSPSLPPQDGSARGVAPSNISASHGEYRSITVSWDIVSDADYYYIYKANSPLEEFTICGETSRNQYKFDVKPGSSIYYRVSSILRNGTESSRSNYVMGTSLAQPVISDITDISEDSATVTWYMENVSKNPCVCPKSITEIDGQEVSVTICTCPNKYYKDLMYIVYCYVGTDIVAQVPLEASEISENRAVFRGLNANTKYDYKVEAFLRANQNNSEESDKMDAATARRFRPGPPKNLKAARGTAVDKVELSFELPDMVDIALGDNTYDPKPLYFTISKRIYSESVNNEYTEVCSYFGTNSFGEYKAGEIVTWRDTNAVRGVTYEYQVQSYVDETNKVISSDDSRASKEGWTLSDGEVSYGKPIYTYDEYSEFYENAVLSFNFDFDDKGEAYDYTVVTRVDPINDEQPKDSDGFTLRKELFNFNDVSKYKIEMDLTQKSLEHSPGRGIYSFEVEVRLSGDTVLIDTFKPLGSVEISEDTQPIIVENFCIYDGYVNKFFLSWDNYHNRIYYIDESTDRNNWKEIAIVNPSASNDDVTFNKNFKHSVSNQDPGITKYFRIRPARPSSSGEPKKGQWVYAPRAAQTLGKPVLTLDTGGASYSVITPVWKEAQKADTYRIRYKYPEDDTFKVEKEINKDDLVIDAEGRFKYPFKPEGYNDVTKSGCEIVIIVDAMNSQTNEGFVLSSNEDVRTRLVGPALLDPTATKAVSTQEIEVSWNEIPGAGGYYVFRRQFNMTNTAEEGTESVVYYVPAVTKDIKVTGKNLTINNNEKTDTQTVKAAASFVNSRYTLKDMYMSDNEYNGISYNGHAPTYRNQQNDMVQGMSYRYFVVPVISRGGTIDPLNAIEFVYNKDGSNKNTNIASYKIDESGVGTITYTGAAALEQEGFLIGFGQNVTATKGTYALSGNTNDRIRITWNPPPRLSTVSGFTPKYTVYRRTSGSSLWSPVNTEDSTSFIDNPPERGVAYEYLIGISNAGNGSISQPQSYSRFIEKCSGQRSQRNSPDMLGYMLPLVRMDSVSRNEQKVGNDFAEEVKWYSSNIESSYNSGNFAWSIDGYEVFVMNRNVNANWNRIADITSIPNQINQSVKVTNVKSGDTLEGGLLKVLRDYKHYFKVRSYVFKDGEKIYSPDPDWNYETLFAANRNNQDNANFLQTDYVKWGARQITHTEFAKIATLHVAWGIHQSRGANRFNWVAHGYRETVMSGNNGSSGTVTSEATYAANRWWWNFYNYKPDMDTRAIRHPNGFQDAFYGSSGRRGWSWQYSVTFLTIDTGSRDSRSMIYASAPTTSNFPDMYGVRDNYGKDPFDIKGPSCVPGMYTGKMRFDNFKLGSGQMWVRYPATAGEVSVANAYDNCPLPFTDYQSRDNPIRFEYDEWY